jgi:hypothetical protein
MHFECHVSDCSLSSTCLLECEINSFTITGLSRLGLKLLLPCNKGTFYTGDSHLRVDRFPYNVTATSAPAALLREARHSSLRKPADLLLNYVSCIIVIVTSSWTF